MNTTEPTEPAPDHYEARRPSLEQMLVEDARFAGELEECDNRKLLWLAMQTKAWKDTLILGKDAAILAEIECRLYPEYDGDKVKATEWGWDVCGGEVRYVLDHAAQEQPKCGWTPDTTTESWDTDCGRDIKILVYDFEGKPGFCPGCGRRVERAGHAQEQPAPPAAPTGSARELVETGIEAALIYITELRQPGSTEQFVKAVDYLTPLQTLTDRTMLETAARIIAAKFGSLADRADAAEAQEKQARDGWRAAEIALDAWMAKLRNEQGLRLIALVERDDLRAQLAAAQDETRRLREAASNLIKTVMIPDLENGENWRVHQLKTGYIRELRAALAAQKEGKES